MFQLASRIATCALPLALTAAAMAQTQNVAWVNDSNPGQGSANTFPWSQIGIRYQCLILASQLGNVPHRINDIFVAPQLTMTPTVRTAIYTDIEIRMGMTDVATLQTDWAKNNPSPTTLYRGPLRVTFQTGAWRGLGLPTPFRYVPTSPNVNLCFEVIVWGADAASINGVRALTGTTPTVQRAFYFQWTTNQATPPTVGTSGAKIGLLLDDGNFVVTGEGCQSSASTRLAIGATGWPTQSQPFDVLLSGAKATSPALLALGTSFTMFGPLPLPFDLAPLGAPGCLVWNDIVVTFAAAADGSGNAKITFPPLPPLAGARIYMHWLNVDPTANKLGLTTSSLGRLLGGS